jgi:WD40 repeat protein
MSFCKLQSKALGLLPLLVLAGPGAFTRCGAQEAPPRQADEKTKVDLYGDPLPPGALVRLGTVRYRHGSVGSTFLPDGKTVVGATQSNAIHLWDARSGRLVRTIDTGALNISQHCVLSRDGKRIAVSGSLRVGGDEGWRAAVRVYDTASGKELRTFECDPREGIHAIALTPDGSLLLSLGRSGALRIEEVATGVELLRQQFPGDVMAQLAISADGTMVALGSGPNSRKLYLWKWQSGDEPRELRGPERPGRGLAFSPDGKLLAESSDSGEPAVRLWDVARAKVIHRLEQPDDRFHGHYYLTFSPDGRTVAGGALRNDGGAVHLWDVDSGKFLRRLDIGAGHLSYSPDGQLLVSGRRVWDFQADKDLAANEQAHTGSVARIVAADKDLVITCDDYTTRIWDAATGKQRFNLPFDRWLRDIALSPDGTRLVTSSLDDTVCLWDLAAGRTIFRLPGHGKMGGRRAVAFTPDGKYFLSWGDDFFLRKWDVRNGKAVFEHAIRPTGIKVPSDKDEAYEREMFFHFGHGVLSSDGKLFILEAGGQFFVFDAATGKELRTIPVDGSHVISLAVSPGSKLLLASAWGKQIETKLPDGRTRYSTADQHLVSLWDLATGKTLKQLILPEQEAGPIAFSTDGKLFAEAASKTGGRIRLWSVAAEGEVGSIDVGSGMVRSLAFMPDGKRLISGMHDSTAIIWELKNK